MVEIRWHSQTKGRATANTNFNLHRRASPRPYLGGPRGEIPLGYSTFSESRLSAAKSLILLAIAHEICYGRAFGYVGPHGEASGPIG
jgi:hypothetical protein